MIVDTHCHASTRWYEPAETLLFSMDRYGVDKAVLIQLLGSTDSRDMIAAARAWPDRLSFVGAIDPAAPDAVDQANRQRDHGAVGLRMRASWRSEGGDPYALWRAVAQAGLAVSLVGRASDFVDGALVEIVSALPDLPIILEHLGGLARPDVGNRAAALPRLLNLAAYPSLSLKIPGLGQLAARADLDRAGPSLDLGEIPAILAPIVTAFGPDRLMWGSDFPPVAAREGYGNALKWTHDMLADITVNATGAIFGDNAIRIWNLNK